MNRPASDSPPARQASGRTRLRKPLYLQAGSLLRVDVEGPALRVEYLSGSRQYFPLPRISRIMARGPVPFMPQALLAIVQHGLGIVFSGTHDETLGYLLSARPLPDDTLSQRLQDLQSLGLLGDTLENWRLSRLRMLILQEAGPYLGWLRDLRARTARSAAAGRIYKRTGLRWQKMMRTWRPMLRALAQEHLSRAGVTVAWMDPRPDKPDLAELIAGLLEWGVWRIGLRLRRPEPLDKWRQQVAFLERYQGYLETLCWQLVDDLARHVYGTPLHAP